MLVFAHLAEKRPSDPESAPDPIDEVARRAAAALGDAESEYRTATEDALEGVPAGGELTLVPQVPGVTFNPTSRSFQWRKAVHEETFDLCAGAALAGRTVRGQLTVLHGKLILAEVNLAIAISSAGAIATKPAEARVQESARAYRKIFASYSHKDAAIVDEFARHVTMLGDQYLRDVVSLRSGEEWSERLAALIDEADVFQLFWSSNSMRSTHVKREWEHALSLERTNFVRPTYWEEPFPEALEAGLPPEALRRLHFQQLRGPTRRGIEAPFGDPSTAGGRAEAISTPPSRGPDAAGASRARRFAVISTFAATACLMLLLAVGTTQRADQGSKEGPVAVASTFSAPIATPAAVSSGPPAPSAAVSSGPPSTSSMPATIKQEQVRLQALRAQLAKAKDPKEIARLEGLVSAQAARVRSLDRGPSVEALH